MIGTWVSTPAGLFHPALPIDGPDDLVMLGEHDLLINSVPRERQHSHTLDAPGAPVVALVEEIESWKRDKKVPTWCAIDDTKADTDRRSFTICFDANGLTGGADLVITGPEKSWHRSIFGAAPHDFGDPTRDPVEEEADGDEN